MKKIFIANRGEIAVRIVRAAHSLGIKTVQAVSDADRNMLAARLADETINIGPARATKSYLNTDAIIKAAVASGCDAVHPGYGFLSENASFADAVAAAGLIFIGPDARIIRLMGDKIAARLCAEAAGLPLLPGSGGAIDAEKATEIARAIGFPIMIKAAAGGGGRGIRVVERPEDLGAQIALASNEAKAAFGDGKVYIERFVDSARHIEVQILGDGKNVVHLFERDCSIQRRRQKVWEEAPAASLTASLRDQICTAAVELAKSVSYRGAGTIEFLYDESERLFYFLEMNTRVQVEHPVTEMITGIDIVREMIQIADDKMLSFDQDEVRVVGHAIECRINAEDPDNQFAPNPGKISDLHVPGGFGVRFDGAIYQGYDMPLHYDSLLGKLIVWGEDRNAALGRLRQALGEMEIAGIKTTMPLHRRLAKDASVENLHFDINWLERWLSETSQAPRKVEVGADF
ncbi:MAG: acetyl-CoA carboxylase biotin carboxylase subunit [Rhizobiales bacterium]|nr:acetyl-CoA carboxylase biotin carboxylase subunit [Hyphomicrobiales bacterium]